MKTVFLSVTVLFVVCISYSQNVTIPDANFKNALISLGVDTNEDGEISFAEAETIYYLNVGGKSISDMTGIEAFVNLDTLNCYRNQLTSLDVSKNNALVALDCHSDSLTSLYITNNTALTYLNCGDNQLISLDVSGCNAITALDCHENHLTLLDVSNNTALKYLYCESNQLTSLVVTNNAALKYLYCESNQLTSMDVSGCIALTILGCGLNQLTILDVSNNTALTDLNCSWNKLTILDVSNNTALTDLNCSWNKLTILDVSNNTALNSMYLTNMPTLFKVCVREIPINFWVDKTDSPNVYFTTNCASTSLKPDKVNSRVNIYPNPAKEYIVFDITNISSTAMVELYDMHGKKVLEQKISETKQISVSNLPKGLYMYKLNNSGIIYRGKLIKE